jgi:ferredoxin
MRSEKDVETFSAGPFSVNNTALFLPEYKGVKVGVVVKGCDSRSAVQQLAEKLIRREEVVLIGFPCKGVVDARKIASALGREPGTATGAAADGDTVRVTLPGRTLDLPLREVLAGKCACCTHPNAVLYDHFVGEPVPGREDDGFTDLEAFERMSLEERYSFWQKEMSRCIRCYACRNACPLCICRDHCVATSRDPHWLTQADSLRDKLFFQLIHALHLAGRCTGCGECQRACPVGIPVGLFKRGMERAAHRLFGFSGGLDPEAVPPLQSFKEVESAIKEREW